MKLSDLGLKQKPQTKYFDGGYVSFSTSEGDLSYGIYKVTKTSSYLLYGGIITNKLQYDELMNIKTWNEVIKA